MATFLRGTFQSLFCAFSYRIAMEKSREIRREDHPIFGITAGTLSLAGVGRKQEMLHDPNHGGSFCV
jgi:hypothetical protein